MTKSALEALSPEQQSRHDCTLKGKRTRAMDALETPSQSYARTQTTRDLFYSRHFRADLIG